MDRRKFVALTGVAGATLSQWTGAARGESKEARDYYELRQYQVETEAQRKGLLSFLKDAAIPPALNRIDVGPVGVFLPQKELSPVYVLLRHKTLGTLVTMTEQLAADDEFLAAGAGVIDASRQQPAYVRMESALMSAFTGMPQVEKPSSAPGRVFQLRIYESPTVKTGQKKIEMFNLAEIAIFRRVGLNPVFFGETLIGPRMPNLTYMLGFDHIEQQKAAWKRFREDSKWKKLKALPEYADQKILSGITNLLLVAADGSQV